MGVVSFGQLARYERGSMTAEPAGSSMDQDHPDGYEEPPSRPEEETPADPDAVYVQGVNCGRCGWPNARQVQRGMRRIQFVCQWCEQFTTAVVDPTLKGMIGF
jgi:hypothetical protein